MNKTVIISPIYSNNIIFVIYIDVREIFYVIFVFLNNMRKRVILFYNRY